MVDRNRIAAAAAAIFVHVLLGCAVLLSLAIKVEPRRQPAVPAFAIADIAIPPPRPIHPSPARHFRTNGGSAPRARSPVIDAPPPALPPPLIVVPTVTLPAANGGNGAAHGVDGNGGGNGGSGNGSGAGNGDGDDGIAPVHVRGRIGDRDYPPALSAAGIGGTVAVRYRVGVDGRVSGCAVMHSSGNPTLDMLTCQLIEQRFRFRPARDGDEHAVPSTIVENHTWVAPERIAPERPPS